MIGLLMFLHLVHRLRPWLAAALATGALWQLPAHALTAEQALAKAMELSGSADDATKIRAKMNEAYAALSDQYNPNNIDGVDEKGGSTANVYVAKVEGGKVVPVSLRDLMK